MDALKALVNNPFKERFYEKRKKKTINILTTFFIVHKSGIKTFLKWIVTIALGTLISMTLVLFMYRVHTLRVELCILVN